MKLIFVRAAGLSRYLAPAAALLISFTVAPSAPAAQIDFVFDYTSNTPGVGFLHPTFGAARQNALITAGNLFSNLFGTYFSNTATLQIAVSSTDNPATPTLASAGSYSNGPNAGGFTLNQVIPTKLMGGADPDPGPDGGVDVNWGYSWGLDPNVPAGPGEFDFFAAMFHEFTHAIGFAASFDQTGNPQFGNKGDGTGNWGAFDRQLVGSDGVTRLVNPVTFILNQPVYDASVTGGSCGAGFSFAGSAAVAANGGSPVCIFSPNPYLPGSSSSHLDTGTFTTAMMKHDRGTGPETRTWSGVEVGILTDLGYTPLSVAGVPEPGSVVLLGAGLLVLVGFRRKL